MTMTAVRGAAIAIALAGAVDPAFTVVRPARPEIGLVTDARLPDPDLTGRVISALESRFTVVPGVPMGAAGVVSIGFQLPPARALDAAPGFAVLPEPRAPFVAIADLHAPRAAMLESRVPVRVQLNTWASRGRRLEVALEGRGLVIDRVTREVAADETTETVDLAFLPESAGIEDLRVVARVDDAREAAEAALAIDVRAGQWPVLSVDGRPSWMATFVRRALEADPRFHVTSRVVTSRGAASSTGTAPASLRSSASLEPFHVAIVGAPEDLGEAEVATLEAFMRDRGGAVVLLLDQPSSNRPFQRLAGVGGWREVATADPAGHPLASEWLLPADLPLWIEPVAGTTASTADAPAPIWTTAIGRGRLVVSGALDAWRYRDREAATFDRFWGSMVAEAASGARQTPAPAPTPAGTASSNQRVPTYAPDQRPLIRTWAAAQGGVAEPESRLAELVEAMVRTIQPPDQPQTVYPMRSVWWMAPFALALGAEWWHRRRHGRR